MTRALIVGCGYAGLRLGQRLVAQGCEVVGTTRRRERAAAMEEAGVRPLVGDLGESSTLLQIEGLGTTVVFYLVPPVEDGYEPLEAVLEATAGGSLDAFVYASSTSVYGDRGGVWIDETAVPRPEGTAPEARQRAERAVLAAGREHGTPTRICRITGIYGPGRTLRRLLERGEYFLVRGRDTWVNRIHVDDLVSGLVAAWQCGADDRVYNMADDEPHRASQFALLAAELHGLPAPRWIEEDEARRRFGEDRLRRKFDSKRVRNRRLREELGVGLSYPGYRVGLPAAVREERAAATPPSRR